MGELGRGGRYQAGDPAAPEPATGFTLYTDTILRTLPAPPPRRRVLVPLGADRGKPARCGPRAGSPSRRCCRRRIGRRRRGGSIAAMCWTAARRARSGPSREALGREAAGRAEHGQCRGGRRPMGR